MRLRSVCLFIYPLFVAVIGLLPAQQSAQAVVKNDPLSVVHRFFPFHVGDRLTYRLTGQEEVGSGAQAHMVPLSGRYTETVVSILRVRREAELVEIELTGKSQAYVDECGPEEPKQSGIKLWYVLSPRVVIVNCDGEEAIELALELSKSSKRGVKVEEDGYMLPFKVGSRWGADPEVVERADHMYEWIVEEKTGIDLSAGNFSNCYEMAYRTGPDDEERWVCEGAGLALDEYRHHGTTYEYRIELVSRQRQHALRATGKPTGR